MIIKDANCWWNRNANILSDIREGHSWITQHLHYPHDCVLWDAFTVHREWIVFREPFITILAVVTPLIENDRCIDTIQNGMIDHSFSVVVHLWCGFATKWTCMHSSWKSDEDESLITFSDQLGVPDRCRFQIEHFYDSIFHANSFVLLWVLA